MEKDKSEKKEKKFSTNRFVLPLLFIVFSLIIEMANFLYLGFKNSSGARMFLPTYFLFDFAVILMLAAIIFIFQKKYLVFAAYTIFLIVQVGVNIVNATLHSLFGEILSLSSIKLGAEATAAFSFELIDWGGTILNFVLFIVAIVCGVLLLRFNKSTYAIKYFSAPIIALAVFIMVEAFGAGFFEAQILSLPGASAQENEIESSDQYLWNTFQFNIEAYKKFGFYGFYTKGIYDTIIPHSISETQEQEYVDFIDSGYVEGNKEAPLYGDNLIVILMESIDLFGIDPVFTPTLWDIWQGNNSVVLKNFYARNRTNNSEGITILGSMPRNTTITDAFNAGYDFDYSLPHLFERGGSEDVKTTFFHTITDKFYNRYITHKDDGIGFDDLVTVEDYTGDMVNDSWGNWILDEDFIRNRMDSFLPDTAGRFLTFFSSMSTHGHWTTEKKYFTEYYKYYDENVDKFSKWLEQENFVFPDDKETQKMLRNYKVGTIDLDNTVKMILDEIERRGIQDNTSLLLFADHNTYYHDLYCKIKDIKKSDFSNTYANHIPAMIYSPKLVQKLSSDEKIIANENMEIRENGIIVNSFCNTYDLLPTLCDIYGLESNKNTFLGYSVFSDEIEKSFFASHLGGMFTNNLYSQNIIDVYKIGEVTEEEIEKFKENAVVYFEKTEKMEEIYRYGINGTKF